MGQTQGIQSSSSYRRQTSGSQTIVPSGGFVGPIGPTMSSVSLARSTSPPEDERVPVMFKWTHGGQRVYVTGTFNNWAKEGIPMVRSGQEFYQIVDVSKGVHEYKFLVDGEWKFSHEQPVLQDTGGNVNNVVDIQYYEKYEPAPLKDPLEIIDFDDADSGGEFKNEMIDHPVQTSEPPSAPPLLVKLPLLGLPAHQRSEVCKVLSSNIPQSQVNIPLFSVCGHVMHDATSSFSWISSDAVVCASTIRFAQKFSTNVLVTLNNSTRTDAFPKLYGLMTERSAPHAFERIFGGSPKPKAELSTRNSPPSAAQLSESKSRGNIDISYFTD